MFWCPFARCPASREDLRHVHEYLIFRYQSIGGQIDDVRAGQHDLAAVVPDVGYSQLGDQGVIHLPGAQYLVADAGKGALKPMDRVTRAVPADNGLVVPLMSTPWGVVREATASASNRSTSTKNDSAQACGSAMTCLQSVGNASTPRTRDHRPRCHRCARLG